MQTPNRKSPVGIKTRDFLAMKEYAKKKHVEKPKPAETPDHDKNKS